MGLRHRAAPDLRRAVPPRVDPHRARQGRLLRNFLASDELARESEATQLLKHISSPRGHVDARHLSAGEAEAAMHGSIMTGDATPAQIGAFLVALRMKGETVEEITGSRAGHARQRQPGAGSTNGRPLVDTCGTGGDGAHTFNISTAAAFVVAGAGRTVAKHGNRAASSQLRQRRRAGRAGREPRPDPRAGGPVHRRGRASASCSRRSFHPAMKHAIGPRRELGLRTIFNLLGPLTNPAGADAPADRRVRPGADRAAGRGAGRAGQRMRPSCVHGYGGLDELTTAGPNRVSHLLRRQSDAPSTSTRPTPNACGLRPRRRAVTDLRGGDPAENARMMRDLLAGSDTSPRRDVVLLNAAAALAVDRCDLADSPRAGARRRARRSRDRSASGAALAKLDALIAHQPAVAGACRRQ